MNLAILIDAENILPAHADQIFSHAASLGTVVYKEIYGAGQALTTWVEPVLKYALHPNLTIRASKGKNSSDIALVIGAMDLLAAGGLDAVIIASSDSDFSALSVRLRNAGIEVIGMGTEKANPLWRTACSSFVPFQPPKPAQQSKPAPAPKSAQQQPKQPQKPAQPQQKPAHPQKQEAAAAASAPAQKPGVAATHGERAGIIREFISAQLAANGGRMQSNSLFTALNNLPEYRVDQQRSRRRPLNYLTRQYSDAFDFEEGSDGNSWVSFHTGEAAKDEPIEQAAPVGEDAPIEQAIPAGEDAPIEQAIPAGEDASIEQAAPAEETAPAAPRKSRNRRRSSAPAEPEAPEAPEEVLEENGAQEPVSERQPAYEPDDASDMSGEEPADPLKLLMDAGLEEDVASQIVVIFTESTNLREAYNKLRATFGNTTGREYYQKVKEIAGAQ